MIHTDILPHLAAIGCKRSYSEGVTSRSMTGTMRKFKDALKTMGGPERLVSINGTISQK